MYFVHIEIKHRIFCSLVFLTCSSVPVCLSSYLHCRWADLEELEKDKRIHQKVKRFKAKQQLNSFITEVRHEVCPAKGRCAWINKLSWDC